MADREPLVLLHALGMSPRVWGRVRPALEPHHEVIPPRCSGIAAARRHRAGRPR